MILLDTHIWVNWIVKGNSSLSSAVVNAMQNADGLAVSAISCFEVSLLVKRGKLELPCTVDEWLLEALVNSIFRSKMISRRREGGDADVLLRYVEENPTKPTKIGL